MKVTVSLSKESLKQIRKFAGKPEDKLEGYLKQQREFNDSSQLVWKKKK
jgi:hypothetical protein